MVIDVLSSEERGWRDFPLPTLAASAIVLQPQGSLQCEKQYFNLHEACLFLSFIFIGFLSLIN